MEITVRTYDEVSNERVRIEVAPGQRAEIQIVDDRVSTYNPAQAAEVLAENYARAQARIKELEAELARPVRGHVCTENCKPNAHVAMIGRKRLQEAETRAEKLENRIRDLGSQVLRLTERAAKVSALEAQVREYDLDRKTERDRADQNKAWAERAEQRLADQAEENRQSLAARDGLLATATQKINSARELLSADEVDQARRMNMTRTGTVMDHAIGATLRVLDQA